LTAVTLGAETLAALRRHKQAQATLKMKNRSSYKDYGLMFSKEHIDLQTPDAALGQPLNTLSEAQFVNFLTDAEIRILNSTVCGIRARPSCWRLACRSTSAASGSARQKPA
jgi:hypothetical protein